MIFNLVPGPEGRSGPGCLDLLFDVSAGELLVVLLCYLLFFGSQGIPCLGMDRPEEIRDLDEASASL